MSESAPGIARVLRRVSAGCEGASVVDVSPLSGVVGPDSELPIDLSFGPTIEKLFNFNVELRVKNKPTPQRRRPQTQR